MCRALTIAMTIARTAIAVSSAAALLVLSACVVVPIDPRTGQPYPLPGAPDMPPRTTIVMPPAAPAPLQPSVLTARLYPLNEQANQGGLLTALIVDAHTGRGTLTVGYRGDSLQGEATRVDGNFASFGRVHQEVLGPVARAYGGQRGIANAYGAKGVSAQCEYLLTAPAQGTGVCLFSDGAKYQLHFGA
jgi:hypothetical protein